MLGGEKRVTGNKVDQRDLGGDRRNYGEEDKAKDENDQGKMETRGNRPCAWTEKAERRGPEKLP